MVHESSLLVRLMSLIDEIPPAPPPLRRQRGHPRVYHDGLFLKAVVVMVLWRVPTVHALLAVLAEPEMAPVRARLTLADGRYPTRRTWERRLKDVAALLPAQIARLGAYLLALLVP